MAELKKQEANSPTDNAVDPEPNDNPKAGYGLSGEGVPIVHSNISGESLEVLVEVRLRFVTPTINPRPGEEQVG